MAGAKAAETPRASGFEAGVILTSEEPVRPYERPPLSKGYLRGAQLFDSAAVHSAGFYDEHGIESRTSSAVTAIHAGAGQVEAEGGERVGYDRLLLATGATPRCLTVPGAQLDGVNYFRTVADAEQIREAVVSGAPLVIVGAG